MNDGSA